MKQITWSTSELKINGYSLENIITHLESYGCFIKYFNGSKIVVDTSKSTEGLSQELKRTFGIKFYVKEV